jgi:hypothetical protein
MITRGILLYAGTKKAATSIGLGLLLGTFLISGCNKSDSSGSTRGQASFKVQLSASPALSSVARSGDLSVMAAATSIQAKLGGVDLIADCAFPNPPGTCLENGRLPDPDIWVNEGCHDDIAQCTELNTEFFELINPTAANATLNSQGRSIEAGTYKAVRVYMLNNDSGKAVKCDNGDVPGVRPNVPLQVNFAEDLVVAEGESVTVTLVYDPSAVDCAQDGTTSAMFAGLTATVTKN